MAALRTRGYRAPTMAPSLRGDTTCLPFDDGSAKNLTTLLPPSSDFTDQHRQPSATACTRQLGVGPGVPLATPSSCLRDARAAANCKAKPRRPETQILNTLHGCCQLSGHKTTKKKNAEELQIEAGGRLTSETPEVRPSGFRV